MNKSVERLIYAFLSIVHAPSSYLGFGGGYPKQREMHSVESLAELKAHAALKRERKAKKRYWDYYFCQKHNPCLFN